MDTLQGITIDWVCSVHDKVFLWCGECHREAMRSLVAEYNESVEEARSHLGAIMIQAIPSDDPIIIGHVADALGLLRPMKLGR